MLIADTPQKLQQIVNALNEAGKKDGMTMNTSKTKVMKIGRANGGQPLKIEIDGVRLQQVEQYKYLGTIVTAEGKDDFEIKARIAMTRKAFNNLERVLRDRRQLSLRLKTPNCYVWAVVRQVCI